MYVEYKRKEGSYWESFGTRMNPGRNYKMFSLIAGARGKSPSSLEPKGLPPFDDLGYYSTWDAFLMISKGKSEGCCTIEDAKRWKSEIIYRNGEPAFASHPDWHSHTWLTRKEFLSVIEQYNIESDYEAPTWGAIHAAMNYLEDNGYETRLVIWFDN